MRNTMVAEFSLRARRGLWALPAVATLASVFGWSCAMAAGLNDTGVTTCADASGATVSCTAATAVQGQDARSGRDAAAGTGALTKVGGGANGFDFTKISNAGAVLPSTAPLGTAAGEWGCTYDNTTGLMWEVKTNSGFRSSDNRYSWYSTNSATNGGYVGFPGTSGGCNTANRCDTEKFVQDVNTINMCAHSDWRVPTLRELNGLVRLGNSPAIDLGYFPNTSAVFSNIGYWTSSPDSQSPGTVWVVLFAGGQNTRLPGFDSGYLPYLRVVRSGP